MAITISENKTDTRDLYWYAAVAATLFALKCIYSRVLNKYNRVEYYYYEHSIWRYRVLRATVIFLHLVMLYYMRFIFLELIKLV